MAIDSLDKVKELVDGHEGRDLELKKSTGQLERAMETICAFLNGNGGVVLFGVADDGKIIGQEVTDSTKRDIAECIRRLEPSAAVQVSYIDVREGGKQVIVLSVEENLSKPYTYKGRAYQRVESVTTVMSQGLYRELLVNRDDVRTCWEKFGNPNLTLQDIDENEVLKTVRLGIECGRLPENTGTDISVILERLNVMEKGVLRHAAAVLFANREMADYPQCLLRLARFRGLNKNVFIDNQRIYGNLFQLMDAAMAFIFKHLSLSGRIEALEREEHLSVPYKAIREGVLNALCHRSYRDAGGSVGIAIYDDRVEIENPGTFPQDWNIENMEKEHRSKPQNPIIANVLYRRKFLESWGRGIGMMADECKEAGLPAPEYKLGGGFVVLVFRYHNEGAAGQVSNHTPTKYRPSTDQVPTKYRPSTDQVYTLLKILENQELSVGEMMKELGMTHRPTFRTNYLHPALNEGYIAPLYPNQPNHPKQKYRLTDKGKEYK